MEPAQPALESKGWAKKILTHFEQGLLAHIPRWAYKGDPHGPLSPFF
ncbi:uncharacterized protein G2W53_035206 [Senna tora]|uniref:Uncharacterized protein n=1 Tax=Senna tora TaxID=362788 RepID=A0A834SPQ2_9FABA|nr:uncharacterized protein G2W53_035206 [Senna tora]